MQLLYWAAQGGSGQRPASTGANREYTTQRCRNHRNHATLEVEGIDRMYLNVYQPKLQTEKQAAWFFRYHRGQPGRLVGR